MDTSDITLDRDSKYPVYRQLADALRERITAGQVKTNEPLADEGELSRQFSMNRLTLRKALKILQDEGLIYKIWGQGVFVGHRVEEVAAPKSEWKIRMVAISCVESLERSHAVEIAKAAAEALHAQRVEAFRISYLSSRGEKQHLDQNEKALSGAILYPMNESEGFRRNIGHLQLVGIPVVLVGNVIRDMEVDTVASGDDEGAAEAVRHFVRGGHRRIAFVCHNRYSVHHGLREAGYARAVAEAGLRELIVEPGAGGKSPGLIASGYEATRNLFGGRNPPSAILALNDTLAIGIHRALSELKVRVP
ncbi:MAG: GntR family transcriptional regulator, partial [Kiritimatiellae bacterium]|nr:GntR family transcriptional regulator [Kiritimatiellia bacterium]